jgi:hypothetical protein
VGFDGSAQLLSWGGGEGGGEGGGGGVVAAVPLIGILDLLKWLGRFQSRPAVQVTTRAVAAAARVRALGRRVRNTGVLRLRRHPATGGDGSSAWEF